MIFLVWMLFYIALNSPINIIQPFSNHEACEDFRNQLAHKLTIKQSACLNFEPAPEEKR